MQVKEGLYRCHQCGGDFKLEDFETRSVMCYECLEVGIGEDEYDEYDEYDDSGDLDDY